MNPMKAETNRETDFPVARSGEWLATRDAGATANNLLEDVARHQPPNSCIVIDFDGVKAMTFSFADEFIGRFLASRTTEDLSPFGVVVTGLDGDTPETLRLVLQRRSQVIVERTDTGSELLTDDDLLSTSYEVALDLGEFRAIELADRLAITPSNANNRLKRLTSCGAVLRTRISSERGGKEFVYRAVR
jgi:STAS-like domain of unknown function (DUF4325)